MWLDDDDVVCWDCNQVKPSHLTLFAAVLQDQALKMMGPDEEGEERGSNVEYLGSVK
jgi:hypothetical protein